MRFRRWLKACAAELREPCEKADRAASPFCLPVPTDHQLGVLGDAETAVVERPTDCLASQTQVAADSGRMAALLAQLDRVPDRADAFNPLEWDGAGLPK
jgi:antitoxin VapB